MIAVEFEAIIPEPFRVGVIRLQFLNDLRKVGTQIQADMARPTTTWDGSVRFKKRVGLSATEALVEVSTADTRYVSVSEGTKPRLIEPTGGRRAIKFPGTFTSKTIPGTLSARPGSKGPDIFAAYADHKGSKPRNFDVLVREIWDEKFAEAMQESFERAADKTGYAI